MSSRTITLVPVDRAEDDRQYRVAFAGGDEQHGARVDDRLYAVRTDGDGGVRITPEGGRSSVTAWTVAVGDVRWVFVHGRVFELSEARPLARARAGHHGALTAPMPATVRRVLVAVGDAVKRGDSLVVLEAMKMEMPVRASGAGIVTAVHCREGELVQPGLTLIEIDE
jgi:acetyl/propionyl-CoA carboxylase alpha subunit